MSIQLTIPTARTEVLILSGNIDETIPVITNSFGRDDRTSFAIKRGNNYALAQADITDSCSITWQNELFFFGGDEYLDQILKLTDCELTGYGKLSFNHLDGERA